MHLAWSEMSRDESVVFLKEHELHTKERFNLDRITLKQVSLSFYEDCKLVKARILPQEVEIQGRGSVCISEVKRSYFIYSPNVRFGKDKIVPLKNESKSIYLANKIFKANITENNVVDYVKFFGMICEGEDGPFVFVDHEDEIPWSDGIDLAERTRFIGTLSAMSPHDPSTGQFNVGLTEKSPFLLGKVFRLNCPAIYSGRPYSCEMAIADDGCIRMDEDYDIPFDGIAPTCPEEPYYVVQPTIELEKHLKFREAIARFSALPLALIGCLLLTAGLFSVIGSIAIISDLTLGSFWPSSSTWLNGMFLNSTWLLWFIFLASCVGLFLYVLQLAVLEYAEYYAKHRPGWGDVAVSHARQKLRSKYSSFKARLFGATKVAVIAALSAIIFWSVLLFSVQGLFGNAVQLASPSSTLLLRNAVAFTFEQALGWGLRGDDVFGFRAMIENDFDLPNSLTGIGNSMKFAAYVITPISVSAGVARVWRWSAPAEA